MGLVLNPSDFGGHWFSDAQQNLFGWHRVEIAALFPIHFMMDVHF